MVPIRGPLPELGSREFLIVRVDIVVPNSWDPLEWSPERFALHLEGFPILRNATCQLLEHTSEPESPSAAREGRSALLADKSNECERGGAVNRSSDDLRCLGNANNWSYTH